MQGGGWKWTKTYWYDTWMLPILPWISEFQITQKSQHLNRLWPCDFLADPTISIMSHPFLHNPHAGYKPARKVSSSVSRPSGSIAWCPMVGNGLVFFWLVRISWLRISHKHRLEYESSINWFLFLPHARLFHNLEILYLMIQENNNLVALCCLIMN